MSEAGPAQTGIARCPWAEGDALMAAYHDSEWGVPLYDPRRTFEFLVLETFQAGLSWRVVLHKREAFRDAFADFDPERVAAFGPDEVTRMMGDASLIRNRAKLEAAIANARAFVAMEEGPRFVPHAWSFVGGAPIVHRFERPEEVPATTPEAEAWARDLKRRGFRFVGPTVAYAHMQATGMVNDHLVTCPRHAEVAAMAAGVPT
ncbi:MAG: DNA-3-methyladenine glycosylase I [Trueperaceae bacterium]|nr:DNA-3-methyladenine glycosylase I [Trueperaceae bacterium]